MSALQNFHLIAVKPMQELAGEGDASAGHGLPFPLLRGRAGVLGCLGALSDGR